MKGDDVLAFDLEANPIRIVVGEAKFRGTASAAVVNELTAALEKSHSANVPASLQFVADRLFESGENEAGSRVASCNALFAEGRLRLDYVGLLVSDRDAHRFVRDNASSTVARLAVISIGLDDAQAIIDACYGAAAILM